MKTKSILLGLAAMIPIAATAQKPGERKDRRPPPVPPLLAFFDADHDGVLSAEEITAAAGTLGSLDQNGDGEITKDEIRPPRPEGAAQPPAQDQPQGPASGKHPAPPVIAALDADNDGTISAEELEAAPESLKELDENNDGKLSPEELHPHDPPPGNGGRPQGPPPVMNRPTSPIPPLC